MYQFIEYQTADRVATIILNRPEKRNALNAKVITELTDAFSIAENDNAVKIILLKANGDVFSAGADLEYLQTLQRNSYEENLADSTLLAHLFEKIYTLNKIVVAQVQGSAIAGGCGLATVCDFTIASSAAKFGYTEVKIGFVPAIVMFFLLRKIGEAKAKELLLTGKLISATEAEQIGLITKCVDQYEMGSYMVNLLEDLLNNSSGQSLQLTKEMISHVQSMSLSEALKYAAEKNAKARATEDCKKGIDAFLSKKVITW